MATARIVACRKPFNLFSAPLTAEPCCRRRREIFLPTVFFGVGEVTRLEVMGWGRKNDDGSDEAVTEAFLLFLEKRFTLLLGISES